MKTNLEKIGKVLGKEAQKKIKGGTGYNVCQDYHGPESFDANSCKEFEELPEKFKICVMVSFECFPR